MRIAVALLCLPLVACANNPPPTSSVPAARPTPDPVASEREPEPAAPSVLLLEPVDAKKGSAVARAVAPSDPRHRAVTQMLRRPFQTWVLEVGAVARDVARRHCRDDACRKPLDLPPIFVLMGGGNRPKYGIEITDGVHAGAYPNAWYVEIDWERADTLIPHEYGHTMMFMNLPGDVPSHPSTLPHTTSAITNDITAFSEGFGIHFETLGGDDRDEPMYRRLHRDVFATGGEIAAGDAMHDIRDLLTYAQGYRRYGCVKDNCFALLPRTAEHLVVSGSPSPEDLVARWTDSTYDPARVRTLEQMVASEGLVASLIYRLATAPGQARPAPADYAPMFEAMQQLTESRLEKTPAVLAFVQSLLERSSAKRRPQIARIVLEVMRYTVADRGADVLFADLHAAGHRIDRAAVDARLAGVSASLEAAVARIAEDPANLANIAGPELWVRSETTIDLPRLGVRDRPLVFDLNTAPIEFLMTIAGVDWKAARAIDAARRRKALKSVDDLKSVGLSRQSLRALASMRKAHLADIAPPAPK